MTLLFLFDLDGTLIRGGGGGRRAMEAALRHVYGVEGGLDGVPTAGKIDPGIFREALPAHGLSAEGGTSPELRRAYLNELHREITRAPGEVAPGIPELLETLDGWTDAHLGLGTGNLEEGARVKLEPHGLNRYFPTGGFGSDSENRNELIRIGIEKAERHWRTSFESVIGVGDTPLDIACARANRAHCLAVATGGASFDEPAAHDPDLLVQDPADTERVLDTVQRLIGTVG